MQQCKVTPSPARLARRLQLVVSAVGKTKDKMIEALGVLLLLAKYGEDNVLRRNGRIEQQLSLTDEDGTRHLVVDRHDETEGSRLELKGGRITLERDIFDGDARGLQCNVAQLLVVAVRVWSLLGREDTEQQEYGGDAADGESGASFHAGKSSPVFHSSQRQ